MKPECIRNDLEHEAALQRISVLVENDPVLESEPGQELAALALLVEQYEQVHYPMDLPDPISAMNFRMEQEAL